VTQILNNVVVSMVPYCAQKLLGDFLGGFKKQSIESRFKRIESQLVSNEILSYQ